MCVVVVVVNLHATVRRGLAVNCIGQHDNLDRRVLQIDDTIMVAVRFLSRVQAEPQTCARPIVHPFRSFEILVTRNRTSEGVKALVKRTV
jgi:hypothetical protein